MVNQVRRHILKRPGISLVDLLTATIYLLQLLRDIIPDSILPDLLLWLFQVLQKRRETEAGDYLELETAALGIVELQQAGRLVIVYIGHGLYINNLLGVALELLISLPAPN